MIDSTKDLVQPPFTDADDERSEGTQGENATQSKEILNKDTQQSNTNQNPNSPKEADHISTEGTEEEEEDIPVDILDKYKKRLENDDKSVFFDMFQLLITKMSTVQTSIKDMKIKQKQVSEKVAAIERSLEYYAQSMEEMDDDLDGVMNTNIKLVQATVKCEAQIKQLEEKTKQIVKIQNKGSFLVHGLALNGENDCKKQVEEFLKETMEIENDIKVVSAHFIGRKLNSPIWFRVEDVDDVLTILTNSSNLKGKKNAKNMPYRVQQYLTEEEREEKQRQQDLIADNRRLPLSHQVAMKYERGKFKIDGQDYRKVVTTPSIKEVLLADPAKEMSIKDSSISEGDTKTVNGSSFYSYLVEASTMREIQEMYNVIKNEHISATHIVCGYRLFNKKIHSHQDYSDNGEFFAGKTILNVLKEANIWNVAVFVVRYHEGPNLGKQRFDIYSDLAKSAIGSLKRSLNYGQNFTDKELLSVLSGVEDQKRDAEKKRNEIAARGRGRGSSVRGRGRGISNGRTNSR